ncbi:MAG: hypothetical protein K6E56_00580 [Lachnospiraceae bacterium]|nr:hypothetical protein [Lachnospiraceae bacterium]
MLNPQIFLKFNELRNRFNDNHPKLGKFLQVVANNYIGEGTIIEVTVKRADGETVTSNIKLNAEDMELMQALKDLTGSVQ